ncbi:MAG: amidohydrolase family protein [Betaproteobacteria bacterium]|nr:amidohydrolase family protein [Betaproteobacteria bacterium]NCZ74214.1 amidohydrolase family protein [Betaproteobacteria bacterium]NDA21767.1 amidohydrolase family protein [Betaproteobacteria bacterium]NDA32450.1 amidohydrolase family protein [Betaproteobacteria bacterium]NDB13741.1 amidohydrolase family protein [Betaproteobacteria bacterium]
MADVLFTNVRIFDGGGEQPFQGDVLIQGNRISRVGRSGYGSSPPSVAGAQVIDGAGAFLMPGMVEAHTHFSWNDQPSLESIQRMPPEEHILWCAQVAKRYLDMGWTSCVGAATAKPRLDVVIRNAINDGTIVGPRYLAASQEITVPGGLGDTTAPHLPQAEFAFGAVVSGAEEMRRCVRMFCKYGVDSLKINLSGESITGMPSEMSQFTEEEIRVCVEEAKAWGKRVAAHARSTWSIKQCVKQGIEVIYHASFADEEALDLLEAHKFDHFVAPGLAWLINTSYHASAWGLTPEITRKMGYHRELEAAIESMKAMRRRGIRILPGGDYGFAWTPHGTNAKDLEYFVKYIGMSPMEALLSATAWGGPMMKLGKEIGYVREGCLADILLIDGDPLTDITVLQDQARIMAVMKDGEFHRAPPMRQSRVNRWAA